MGACRKEDARRQSPDIEDLASTLSQQVGKVRVVKGGRVDQLIQAMRRKLNARRG